MSMPAGRYYVGDLCYVMEDDEWNEFCSITIRDGNCLDGEFVMSDGRRFATYGTRWGDGGYQDQAGRMYSVDAGLIGCIRVEDIRAAKYTDISTLGNIIDFAADFETYSDRGNRKWDGVIRIGSVRIETDPVEVEHDYDE